MKKPEKRTVRKAIANKSMGQRPCEKVLGSETQVAIVAGMWANHADLFELMAVNEIIEYMNEDFDSKEGMAFKRGIYAMGIFMERCWQEYENAQAERKLPSGSKD